MWFHHLFSSGREGAKSHCCLSTSDLNDQSMGTARDSVKGRNQVSYFPSSGVKVGRVFWQRAGVLAVCVKHSRSAWAPTAPF